MKNPDDSEIKHGLRRTGWKQNLMVIKYEKYICIIIRNYYSCVVWIKEPGECI